MDDSYAFAKSEGGMRTYRRQAFWCSVQTLCAKGSVISTRPLVMTRRVEVLDKQLELTQQHAYKQADSNRQSQTKRINTLNSQQVQDKVCNKNERSYDNHTTECNIFRRYH